MIYKGVSLELFNETIRPFLVNTFVNTSWFMITYAYLGNFLCMYLMYSAISMLYHQKVSKTKLLLASFITSFIYELSIFICVYYFYFDIFNVKTTYWLSLYPPYFIFILYLVLVYVIGINKYRCVYVINHCYYILISIILIFCYFDSLCFYLFTQNREYENIIYFLANSITYLTIFIAYVYFTKYVNKYKLWFTEYILNSNQKVFPSIFYCFWKTLIIYFIMTEVLFYVCPELNLKGVTFVFIILILLVLWVNFRTFTYNKLNDLKNKLESTNALMAAQMKAISDFSSVKHDISNMMQVYHGYITLGDINNLKRYHESVYKLTTESGDRLSVVAKIQENPALYTTILYKMDKAAHIGVLMRVSCVADATYLAIHPIDLSRILGILLDNAIEEAIETDKKFVQFYTEPKRDGTFLITVSNSTRGDIDTKKIFEENYTTKDKHNGIGLYLLWSFIRKLPSCSLNVDCFNNTITFYLEIGYIIKGKDKSEFIQQQF